MVIVVRKKPFFILNIFKVGTVMIVFQIPRIYYNSPEVLQSGERITKKKGKYLTATIHKWCVQFVLGVFHAKTKEN